MRTAKLPPSIGVYRIVKDKEFTVEQLAILRAARREHVHERLVALVGEGKILASQAVQMYKRLMDEAEEGKV